jgi:UDP-2,4-diacetamido-2,4,6-trideoxy-beta-L-altropyranose hydrolase
MRSTRSDKERIVLRAAVSTDRDVIFEWRNDENTRRYFRDAAPVKHETHVAWFAGILESDDQDLLIAESSGEPAGVLRYDYEKEGAEVSVYMAPDQAGNGLGSETLRQGTSWVASHRPEIRCITALIHRDNAASVRAFEKAGYISGEQSDEFVVYERPLADSDRR